MEDKPPCFTTVEVIRIPLIYGCLVMDRKMEVEQEQEHLLPEQERTVISFVTVIGNKIDAFESVYWVNIDTKNL